MAEEAEAAASPVIRKKADRRRQDITHEAAVAENEVAQEAFRAEKKAAAESQTLALRIKVAVTQPALLKSEA
jgi:hypothetical protein